MSSTKRTNFSSQQMTRLRTNKNVLENPMIIQKFSNVTGPRKNRTQSLRYPPNNQIKDFPVVSIRPTLKIDHNDKHKSKHNQSVSFNESMKNESNKNGDASTYSNIIDDRVNNEQQQERKQIETNDQTNVNQDQLSIDLITEDNNTNLDNAVTKVKLIGKPTIKDNESKGTTIVVEPKVNENQETIDLLNRIKQIPKPATIGPMPLSEQSCRFELPFDLRLLEILTPLEYLTKYCRLSSRRKYQFERVFHKYRNRNYRFDSSDLYSSLTDIHKEHITDQIFKYLCELIDIDNKQYQFTFDTYSGILALTERILYKSLLVYNVYDNEYLAKDIIERCDFYSLNRKLDGLSISYSMKRLLNAL